MSKSGHLYMNEMEEMRDLIEELAEALERLLRDEKLDDDDVLLIQARCMARHVLAKVKP